MGYKQSWSRVADHEAYRNSPLWDKRVSDEIPPTITIPKLEGTLPKGIPVEVGMRMAVNEDIVTDSGLPAAVFVPDNHPIPNGYKILHHP